MDNKQRALVYLGPETPGVRWRFTVPGHVYPSESVGPFPGYSHQVGPGHEPGSHRFYPFAELKPEPVLDLVTVAHLLDLLDTPYPQMVGNSIARYGLTDPGTVSAILSALDHAGTPTYASLKWMERYARIEVCACTQPASGLIRAEDQPIRKGWHPIGLGRWDYQGVVTPMLWVYGLPRALDASPPAAIFFGICQESEDGLRRRMRRTLGLHADLIIGPALGTSAPYTPPPPPLPPPTRAELIARLKDVLSDDALYYLDVGDLRAVARLQAASPVVDKSGEDLEDVHDEYSDP